MVSPGTGSLPDHRNESIASEAVSDRLGDVARATPRASVPVNFLYELLRKQEVCAHSHAHKYAQAEPATVNALSEPGPAA